MVVLLHQLCNLILRISLQLTWMFSERLGLFDLVPANENGYVSSSSTTEAALDWYSETVLLFGKASYLCWLRKLPKQLAC